VRHQAIAFGDEFGKEELCPIITIGTIAAAPCSDWNRTKNLKGSSVISDRFEDFAQSLRIFIEQKFRFQQLFLVDPGEAIGNVELACKGMLDTFASIYDAARESPTVDFDFYASPLCCCILAYRNAKHHNKANGIRSAHRYAQFNKRQDLLLVNFAAGEGEEGGDFIDHYASWGDFCTFLEMPSSQSKLRATARELIRGRLSADKFEQFAERDGVPLDRVFVNMVPIIIGAGSEFIPKLKPHIHAHSTEAEHFLWHFENVEQANFSKPKYIELTSAVFG
jgi:hypothetical protein